MFAASRMGIAGVRASRAVAVAGTRFATRPQAPHALAQSGRGTRLGAQQTGRRWMCAEPKGQPEPVNRNPENLPTPVKVVAATKTATKGALYMVLASATLACGYFIVRELMPSRMSPNSLFNEAFDRVQDHPDVTARIGSPVKGYGKDHGGRRAGRRNFVENQTYTDKEGIQRMRIRFNVEGPRGKGIVYTEIAESMGKGDFYYLVFQDRKTGEAIGIIDNRPVITRQQRQKQVVEALEEGDGVLYGTEQDEWTLRQLSEFGKFAEKVKFVRCDPNSDHCAKLGITGFPTWVIRGQQHRGYHRLEDMAVIAEAKEAKTQL